MRSVIGSLGWIARQCRPDLSYHVSRLQGVVSKATLQDLKDEVGSLERKKPEKEANPPSALVSFDEGNEKITTEEAVEAVTPGKRRRRWRRGRRRKRKNQGNGQQPGNDNKPGPESGRDG